jgi:hypothetical protein
LLKDGKVLANGFRIQNIDRGLKHGSASLLVGASQTRQPLCFPLDLVLDQSKHGVAYIVERHLLDNRGEKA